MKRRVKQRQNVRKGTSSAVLLSVAIHAGLFLLAGALVVFTVTKVNEPEFEAPKAVERPKMKLRKPKLQLKKNAKPKSTTRIVTRNNRANMPDIELPEMSGIGSGLGDGIGDGFIDMPDLDEIGMFGSVESVGNDFEGTFYDFKRDLTGREIPMSDYQFVDELIKFGHSGWNTKKLSKYYKSERKLYATTFTLPLIPSSFAPTAFHEPDTLGYAWMIHYTGPLVHKDGIKFRFWGHGDDILIVLVNKRVVLNASWPDGGRGTERIAGSWQSSSPKSRQYYLGNKQAVVGDWITLEPGVPLQMDVFMGEVPGGTFCSFLLVEVEGEKYETNKQSGPILPIFKTDIPSHELVDAIAEHLVEGEASITNGPVFCDYDLSQVADAKGSEVEEQDPVEPKESDESPLRLWHTADEKSFEAEYLSLVNGNVILQNTKGRQLKMPLSDFSPEDRRYVELENPPRLDITFTKQSSQRIFELSPFVAADISPQVLDYVFGVKLKQMSAGEYNRNLRVEYYAIGQQTLDARKYILLDRQTKEFVLNRENKRSFQFNGDPVELMTYEFYEVKRGRKFSENLVVVIDERNKIIQSSSSCDWLLENIEKLRKLPIGAFMDKTCARVHPTGPTTTKY